MKKILSLILIVLLMTNICNLSVNAANENDNVSKTLFCISSEVIETVAEIDPTTGAAIIPINVCLNDKFALALTVVVSNDTSSTTMVRNISVSGYFYLTATGQKVTTYGLSGSFEYDGTQASITGSSSYHNSAYEKWTGTCKESRSSANDGSVTLSATYDCINPKGKVEDTCEIRITIDKDGMSAIGGSYSNIIENP